MRPAAIALLPGNLLWRRALPIEGVSGRLLADAMVQYLNLPGAVIVLALMVALSLYLATTFTFNTAREWMRALRFLVAAACMVAAVAAMRDELAQDGDGRASRAGGRSPTGEARRRPAKSAADADEARRNRQPRANTLLGGLFGWWGRKGKAHGALSLNRAGAEARAEPASMWQAMPRTIVDAPPVTPLGTAAAAAAPYARALAAGGSTAATQLDDLKL